VGEQYINNQKRLLDDATFKVVILNERRRRPPVLFYPNFKVEKHTYHKFDYGYLGNLEIDYRKDFTRTCWQDGDLIPGIPLDVTIDAGGHINVCLTGQDQGDVYRVLKGIEGTDKIGNVAQDWCDYYAKFKKQCTQIKFIYDQTDIPDNANTKETTADIFMRILHKNGWEVIADYRGAVPYHMERFNVINEILHEENDEYKPVRINKYNCEYLVISIEGAELKIGKTGYEKEKKYERNLTLDQRKTTHYSDAFDKLIYHVYFDKLNSFSGFAGAAAS